MTKKVLIAVGAIAAVAQLLFFLWPSKKDVALRTSVVSRGVVQRTVTATGNIQPADKVEVGTQVSGKVEKLYVTYNSKVKKGQVLAELDKSTLQERLAQTQSSMSSAESALKLAKQNYERTKALYEAKAATQTSFEEATNSYIQAQNTFANAQTNVREARVNLSYAVITSPIDGIVLDKQVDEGQTVASSFNTPTLFVIAKDLKNMHVEANIDEADIGHVKKGQKVTFTVDSYNGDVFNGEVLEIRLEPKVTSNVVTYTVIIKAENPEEKLYPGMTASVTVVTQEEEANTVAVAALNFKPTEELFKALGKPDKKGKGEEGDKARPRHEEEGDEDMMRGGQTVWVKRNGNIYPKRVETGMSDGVNAIVKSGLAEGDSVVVSAQIGVKEKPKAGGTSPFMPQRPGGNKKR